VQPKSKKFIGIELLRFICAFSIVIRHHKSFAADDITVSLIAAKKIDFSFFQFFHHYFNLSVDIFWAISGFVLFWRYAEAFYEKRLSGRDFAILRFSRLYPLHILTLGAVIVLQLIYHGSHDSYFFYPSNFDLYHFFLHILLISHWGFENGHSFNQVAWSVSVENIACIIFFLSAFKLRLHLLQTFMAVILLYSLVVSEFFIVPIVRCIMLFFCGGMVYQIYRKIETLEIGSQKIIGWIVLFVALVLLVASQSKLGAYFYMRQNIFLLQFLRTLIFIPAVLLSFVLLVNPIATSFASKTLQFLGKPTYTTYLVHFPMQILFAIVTDSLNIPRDAYNSLPLFLTYMVCVYATAYFLFYTYEMPSMIYLRTKFLAKKNNQIPENQVVQNI